MTLTNGQRGLILKHAFLKWKMHDFAIRTEFCPLKTVDLNERPVNDPTVFIGYFLQHIYRDELSIHELNIISTYSLCRYNHSEKEQICT